MRFAKNRLYIEAYIKCRNCGVLIYDDPEHGAANQDAETKRVGDAIYCSQWCFDWETDRTARQAADADAT